MCLFSFSFSQGNSANKEDQSNNTEISISVEDADQTEPDIKLDRCLKYVQKRFMTIRQENDVT